MMNERKTILTAGFAMFSMFFGSGNLVFPLLVGTQTLDNGVWGAIGILLTGVFIPFLGLLGVILYAGNRSNFLGSTGKVPAFLLALVMLSLLGPFGVVPRCIIVAYGGVSLFLPGFGFVPFALMFSGLTLFLIWKHDRVIPIIGRVLTPSLLAGLVMVIAAGILSDSEVPSADLSPLDSFKLGFYEGYQMMDLLAAFFFCATTVAYLRAHLRSDDGPKKLMRMSLKASFLGAGMLVVVYLGFVLIGAKNAQFLNGIRDEQMLVGIAGQTLGPYAIPVAGLSIVLACLTTATILAMLFSDFLQEEICRKKVGKQTTAIVTLVISFIVSLVGFDSLRVLLGTILDIVYPALIALTVFNIIGKFWNIHLSKWAFWLTVAFSLYSYVF